MLVKYSFEISHLRISRLVVLFVSYQTQKSFCTHKTHILTHLWSLARSRTHIYASAAKHKEKHYVKMSHRQLQDCPPATPV